MYSGISVWMMSFNFRNIVVQMQTSFSKGC